MIHDAKVPPDPEGDQSRPLGGGANGLALIARLHEIDRRLFSMRFTWTLAKWTVLPGLALIGGLFAHYLITTGHRLGVAQILAGCVTLLGAGLGIFNAVAAFRSNVDDLETERHELVSSRGDALPESMLPVGAGVGGAVRRILVSRGHRA